jgi:Domain of unknown function (DUF4129)
VAEVSARVVVLAATAGAQTDPETARETADEVLSRPEFEVQRGLIERFFDWLRELLDFEPPDADTSTPGMLDLGWLGSLVGWVVIAALLGLAAYLLVRYVRIRGRRGKTFDEATAELEDVTPSRDPLAGGDPDALEATGRWREAMLVRYRRLVSALVDSGLLAPVPGRTAGEYSDDVAEARPDLTAPFDDATELFERAWYGDLPTGAPESRQFQKAAGRVLAGTSQSRE